MKNSSAAKTPTVQEKFSAEKKIIGHWKEQTYASHFQNPYIPRTNQVQNINITITADTEHKTEVALSQIQSNKHIKKPQKPATQTANRGFCCCPWF